MSSSMRLIVTTPTAIAVDEIPFATSAPRIRAALLVSNPAMRIFSPRFRSAS